MKNIDPQKSKLQNQELFQNSNRVQQGDVVDDEIRLRELVGVIWRGKWLIIFVTTIFAVASVYYALSIPNEYKSTVLLAPASNSSSSSLSKLAGQYGSLASLAGINLGGGGDDKVAIAMEIIKTWGFLESFIENNNLQVPVFAAQGWDRLHNKLMINPKIYDESNNQWVRAFDPNKGERAEPSSWMLYKELEGRVNINEDKTSGIIDLSVEYYSPVLAKQWVELLVKAINTNLQAKDRDDATKSIQYLQNKIRETDISDMQTVFYQLIEEQTKTLMLAEVSDEYVFKTISPAKVAEQRSKPRRSLIVLVALMLGGMLSVLIVLIRFFMTKQKK